MGKHINLLNQKFGSLTVIEDACKGWKCECICGKIVYRDGSILMRRPNDNKSCGCKAFNHGRRKPNFETSKNRIFSSYVRGAKLRNINFTLTKEQFYEFLSKPCYYCQSLPSRKCSMVCYKSNFIYNGIDRLDNSKGYIIENCVPCCTTCNKSKSNLSLLEWQDWIKKVSLYLKNDPS